MIVALVQRELRAQARNGFNPWLRVGGAAAVLFALFSVWNQDLIGNMGTGRSIFRGLNFVLAVVIWILAPVMTADCLSRENRDGTLPLLFLASLRPLQVVVAKSAIHFIRAGLVLLAAFPVLMVPVMLGGLTWLDLVRVLILHVGALVLALAAGLSASACCRHWLAARVLAALFMFLGGAVFLSLHFGTRVAWSALGQPANMAAGSWIRRFVFEWVSFWMRSLGPGNLWRDWSVGSTHWSVLAMAIVVAALCVLTAGLAIGLASRAVARTWRDVPSVNSPSHLRHWLQRPLSGSNPWWHRRRGLARGNPIAWLQTGTHSARLGQLGWIAGVCAMFVAVGPSTPGRAALFAGGLLLLGMAVAAVGSFNQELESGAMELLLVSPLEPAEIIRGRTQALMWYFAPGALAVAALWAWGSAMLGGPDAAWAPWFAAFAVAFFVGWVALRTMSLVGVAFALSGFPFAGALFMASLLVVGLPMPLLVTAFGSSQAGGHWRVGAGLLFLVFQTFNLWRSWLFAQRQLAQRRYLPERTQSLDDDASSLGTAETPRPSSLFAP